MLRALLVRARPLEATSFERYTLVSPSRRSLTLPTYHPHTKHKSPKGYGSLCPLGMPTGLPQTLLDDSIVVPAVSQRKRWAVAGNWLFCALPDATQADTWHGFPVAGALVDVRVLYALQHSGRMSTSQRRYFLGQRAVPGTWE